VVGWVVSSEDQTRVWAESCGAIDVVEVDCLYGRAQSRLWLCGVVFGSSLGYVDLDWRDLAASAIGIDINLEMPSTATIVNGLPMQDNI